MTEKPGANTDEAADEDIGDCQHMVALGLVPEDGVLRMSGSRDQVRAAMIEAMASCRDLFQSDAPMEDENGAPTALLLARREHLDMPDAPASTFSKEWRRENDPMRLALDEAHRLFDIMAQAIFAPDPPSQGVRNLPKATFAGVPYFFDLEELVKASGYDVEGIVQPVEGETSERAREMSSRALSGSDASDGFRQRTERPDPAPSLEAALGGLQPRDGASP